MSTHASHPTNQLLPSEIDGFDSLAELAWTCTGRGIHATDEVWRQLDSELWEITHDPWVVLQTVSRDQIERMFADAVFRKKVDGLVEAGRQATEAPAWFQRNYLQALLTYAAYFSMELMLLANRVEPRELEPLAAIRPTEGVYTNRSRRSSFFGARLSCNTIRWSNTRPARSRQSSKPERRARDAHSRR
jgi:hypothetical protein